MKTLILNLALFIFTFSSYSQSNFKEAAIFGEHTEKVSFDKEKKYHIHIDKNGDFYPNYLISDADIKGDGENQLKIWAMKFPSNFTNIAKAYKLSEHNYSEKNFRILQDSIIAEISNSINQYSKGKSQIWLIHGFRKNLYQKKENKDRTSLYENSSVKKEINKFAISNSYSLPYYVEVYWDGNYRKIYKGLNNKVKLAKLFKQAIPNARNCGYALRDVFQKIECNTISIITHSTGTHIGTNLLFNVIDEFDYNKPTPSQNIKLILVGSASSGKELFKNYYNRITSINFNKNDNYTIINAYNVKDGVLRKNLLSPSHASTKLGCDYQNESGKLLKLFLEKFKNSKFIENKVTYRARKNNWNHIFYNYIQDSSFTPVLSIIFNE